MLSSRAVLAWIGLGKYLFLDIIAEGNAHNLNMKFCVKEEVQLIFLKKHTKKYLIFFIHVLVINVTNWLWVILFLHFSQILITIRNRKIFSLIWKCCLFVCFYMTQPTMQELHIITQQLPSTFMWKHKNLLRNCWWAILQTLPETYILTVPISYEFN